MNWYKLAQIGINWKGSVWIGIVWDGLVWIGMDYDFVWIRMDSYGLV